MIPIRADASPDPQAEAARWLVRRRSEDCSDEERQAFLRWLNSDETHRQAYAEAERLWRDLGGMEQGAARHLAEARAHLARHRRRPLWRRLRGCALAASLVATVALTAGWLHDEDERVYRTAIGERQSALLADGSRLDLDTDSEVTVHYTWRRRELRLVRGQAAFAVAHGDGRPFDVHADAVRIRDIGTGFNVRRNANRIAVAVMAGAVEVFPSDGAPGRGLRQGQQLSLSPGLDSSAVVAVDAGEISAWRDGRLVFHALRLGDVLAELGRYHKASLDVSSPRILDIKVSGVFPTDDLALALRTVAATLPVKLTRIGPDRWRLDG